MNRILHIVGIMNQGGIENFLMNVYRQTDRSKIQFDFLVTREEEGFFDKEIRSLGGRIFNIPHIKKVGMKKHKEQFSKVLKQTDYKIVHCHMSTWCWLYLPIARKLNISTRIAHSHIAYIKLGNPQKIFEYMCKLYTILSIDKFATHFFACSYEAGGWLFGKKRVQKVKVIPNGIDLERFAFNKEVRNRKRSELGIEQDDIVIGHIGRMDYAKNHGFLLDIFKHISIKNENAKLFLVGEGELRKELEEKVNKLNLREKVIFLGIRSDVNELLCAFDMFVFPSHYEGFGIVLLEAQATGLQCIASDTIPKNTDMKIGNIEYIGLNKTAEYWAENILSKQSFERIVENQKIRDLGFDIKDVTNWLSSFYLEVN